MKRKWLAVGIILLLGMNIASLTSGSLFEKTIVKEKLNPLSSSYSRGMNITLTGTKGWNDWYVSNVEVWFSCDTDHFYYNINGGAWIENTGPNVTIFTVDGYYNVSAYCVYENGTQSPIVSVSFKIDSTSPIISLVTEGMGHNKVKISAETYDATSGVDRVDFYQNYFPIYTDDTSPYEWMYKGPSFKLDAIAYDKAGNGVMAITFPDQNQYFAIGFIEHPQIQYNLQTFYAKFVIVYEHQFPFYHHVSTLTNQQFAVPRSYTGKVDEHFILIRYQGP